MEIGFGTNDDRDYDRPLSRSATADPGLSYVSNRSNAKSKKEKRKKSKRSGSSSRSSRSMSASTSSINFNPSDSTLNDSFSGMDGSAPDILSSPTTSSTASPSPTRSSVNPSSYESSTSTYDYASRYIVPPVVEEEQDSLLQSSKNADPNDPLAGHENFQDEFEDEMDEIEMNGAQKNFINLAEAQQVRKRSRCCGNRKCWTWICNLLVLGAVVGTIVAVVLMKGGKDKTPQAVPEASKLLKLWCAEELDLGPGQSATYPLTAPKDCQVACNKADCCWNPDSDHFCTPETEKFCEGYKKPCDIMLHPIEDPHKGNSNPSPAQPTGPIVVPKAPATLKTICVPEGPEFAATRVCYDICRRADCCWNQTSNVQCTPDSHSSNCGPYDEFCSFFNEHPPKGHFSSSSSGASQQQQQQQQQNINEENLPFPYASPELATVCALDNVESNGADDCKEQCAVAECCWRVGMVNCANKVPNNMCKDYTSHCAILNHIDSILANNNNNNKPPPAANNNNNNNANTAPFPPAPNGLNVYCDPSEMAEVSLHICEDKCAPAACCWSTNADSCGSNVSGELCQPYVQACAILNDLATYPGNPPANSPASPPDNDPVPLPPNDFNTRCAKENILNADNGGDVLISCEKDCLKASCCWQPNADSCSDDSRCGAYEDHCSVFVGLFKDPNVASSGSGLFNNGGSTSNNSGGTNSNSGSSSSSSNVNVPAAPSDLAQTCAPSNLSTSVNAGAGIVQCERECLAAACCWKQNHSTECPGAAQCAAYMEPCGTNLVNALVALETGTSVAQASNTQDNAAKNKVASACDAQKAIFVKATCEAECRPGNCCFNNAVACPSSVDCSIYDPCNVLFRRNLRATN